MSDAPQKYYKISVSMLILFITLGSCQSGCNKNSDPLSSIKQSIIKQYPSLRSDSKKDVLIKAQDVFAWSYKNFLLTSTDDLRLPYTTDIVKAYSQFKNHRKGVFCGGASSFFVHTLYEFQIPALSLGIGKSGTFSTHTISIVAKKKSTDKHYKLYIFDLTFGVTYWNKKTQHMATLDEAYNAYLKHSFNQLIDMRFINYNPTALLWKSSTTINGKIKQHHYLKKLSKHWLDDYISMRIDTIRKNGFIPNRQLTFQLLQQGIIDYNSDYNAELDDAILQFAKKNHIPIRKPKNLRWLRALYHKLDYWLRNVASPIG